MLNNKLGITSNVELAKEEEKITKLKAIELFDSGKIDEFEVGTFKGLSCIHEYLFSDIYSFAGKIRKENISKGNFRFASCLYLESVLKSIDAMEILKDTTMPIVIFHGGLDFFCNVKISQKIKKMNLSNVSVYIYPDSNHCCSYVKHEKEYENIISRLIEQ